MPEVVEVKKYCDMIRTNCAGKNLNKITILSGRYKTHKPFEGYGDIRKVLPVKLESVNSKGKYIYMIFNGDNIMGNTLGLSGGWVFKTQEDKYIYPDMTRYFIEKQKLNEYQERALNHLRVEFEFDNGSLYFFDQISYGTIGFFTDIEKLNKKLSTLGADIMDETTTLEIFTSSIKKYPKKAIGEVLLNQKLLSGIGNYLRADALWAAKISPFRKVKDLEPNEITHLFNALKGLTWGDYDMDKAKKLGWAGAGNKFKMPSDYSDTFFVYDHKETDVLGNPVRTDELGNRTIYWAPSIQI